MVGGPGPHDESTAAAATRLARLVRAHAGVKASAEGCMGGSLHAARYQEQGVATAECGSSCLAVHGHALATRLHADRCMRTPCAPVATPPHAHTTHCLCPCLCPWRTPHPARSPRFPAKGCKHHPHVRPYHTCAPQVPRAQRDHLVKRPPPCSVSSHSGGGREGLIGCCSCCW